MRLLPILSDNKKTEKIGSYNKKKHYHLKNKKGASSLNVALVGNPNSGKSTLFNQLTGSHQHVGNWPGVTVEKKEGSLFHKNLKINIVDLPGVYSLSPCSFEEIITRNYLLENKVDIIINIVDATNLERNLYLTTQLLELKKPLIVALNMCDLLKSKNLKIELEDLEKFIKVPVVPISASKASNLENLLDEVTGKYKAKISNVNIFDGETTKVLKNIENCLIDSGKKESHTSWLALKIFEDDKLIERKLQLSEKVLKKINKFKDAIKLKENVGRQTLVAMQRYGYLNRLCKSVVKKGENKKARITDILDDILLNKFLAFPLFFLIIALIFYITFGPLGNFLKDIINSFICNDVGSASYIFLNNLGASNWCKLLIRDGIIQGVGSVVSFLPQIILLFTLLSILEDSGYMARAAFIMDKPLKTIGLSGKAFVPLLMGFGCSVPAILGTRILEKDKDKKRTIFMIPFMSCSAKMPIYAMFISVFFNEHRVLAIFSIYLIGILVSIFTGLILKKINNKKEQSVFIMELPDYKLPTAKNLFYHVFDKVRDFLEKAATVLIGASIVIWFLQSFSFSLKMVEDSSESILAFLGEKIAPIFNLCGFGNWKASVSLICGVIAKESVISTMAILYNKNEGSSLHDLIMQNFTKASACSFMVFALLYTPCMAALSAIKKELSNNKLFFLYVIYQLLVAWGISALVFSISKVVFGC